MNTIQDLISKKSKLSSQVLSALGGFGVALQNYPAVELFVKQILKNASSASHLTNVVSKTIAFGAGGMCSGMVNYWMNIELLNGFFERFHSGYSYKKLGLTDWQKLQYFSGILVFVVTGLLFGLMAFTFTMEGPLAVLSLIAGVFVSGIMTIQEVETWISSFDKSKTILKEILTPLQKTGQFLGHVIAVGNVFALSLLFTLSLAQSLAALSIAAFPALMIGLSVAFSFGAFTEYYFYNFYLADFCKNFEEKWKSMLAIPNNWVGFACVSVNAFVNGALAFTGIQLLTTLLISASVALPPLLAITVSAAVLSFFTGSASFILGMDFWIRQNPTPQEVKPVSHHTFSMFHPSRTAQPSEANIVKNRDDDLPITAAPCAAMAN